jgi:hypothetical protein
MEGTTLARANDVPATRDGCLSAQNIVTSVIVNDGVPRLRKGSRLCAQTEEGNVVSLTLKDFRATTDADDWWLRFDALVWPS